MNTKEPSFHEAPLVHFINTDVNKLDQDELEAHIAKLREMRASPQTSRARTNTAPRKSKANIDAARGML